MGRPKPPIKVGERFDRWTVLAEAGRIAGRRRFHCRCACGTEKTVDGPSLRAGASRSCGCLIGEAAIKTRLRHGDNRANRPVPEYRVWTSMKNRCSNPKCQRYAHYGGRGIGVCDRWSNSYENFLADMGRRPTSLHSIDRIDVDGNYEPGNCRWATRYEQRANRRDAKP